ncbi:hypothetical protein E1301_Tti005178 [Triplophysa tibetana]|uniref:E3 ubiquitin-protein ligase RNF182 n=1 Tax=Triplophysa tibetana TaxID=1572043 RepID=A0A5A9PLP1_9TELE|nr:hypothetical protein E1301_Tti005178 [Triplophysa tibetana]
MFSLAECGICYRTYNAGSRCPRLLSCKHTFCERCLVTLARSAESNEPGTLCPLCRQFTSLSEATIREKLPVDEDILDRLVKAACFDECAYDDEDEEPNEHPSNQLKEETLPTTAPRGRLVRSVRRLCKKIMGNGQNCMTDEDLRDLAMMTCYMT